MGPTIVVSLLRRSQSDWRRRLTTPLLGAIASAIFMFLFVLLYRSLADLAPSTLTQFAVAGALIGAGLGIGASVTTDKWRQLGAIVLGGTLAVVLANVLVGVPQVSLPAALIGGAILGGLTGAGFFVTADDDHRRSREEVSHEPI